MQLSFIWLRSLIYLILWSLVSFAIFCALRIVGMHLWKRWFIVQILGYIERSCRRCSNAGRYSIITIPISYSFFFSNWRSGLARTHQPCFKGLSSRPWERSQRIFSLSGEGLTVVIFLGTKFSWFPSLPLRQSFKHGLSARILTFEQNPFLLDCSHFCVCLYRIGFWGLWASQQVPLSEIEAKHAGIIRKHDWNKCCLMTITFHERKRKERD